MTGFNSIIYLLLVLNNIIAKPQVQQTQPSTATTAIVQQASADPSGAFMSQSDSLTSSNFNTNDIGFNDANKAGFNPFAIAPKDDHIDEKSMFGIMTIASVIAASVLVQPWGTVAALVIQLGAAYFLPFPPDPDKIYQAIYGNIQNQINTAINNKHVSKMVSQLRTLSENVNDEIVSYLALLGITGNTRDTLHGMAQGLIAIPTVTAAQVDQSMKVIDNLFSAPNNWYAAPSKFNVSSAFILTGVTGIGSKFCLHTKDFNLADGTELVVDTQCNLNSLDDKLWGIAPNNQLILRTNNGDKCVAFNNRRGDNHAKPLAVFDINSRQCGSTRPIKLLQASDSTFSLYDGNRMLCLSDGEKEKVRDLIVSTEKYKVMGIFQKRNKCKNNNFLQFQTRIPVILNNVGAGGSTGNVVTPPFTFDEIGVQLFYFPQFAKTHLAALKEMYLHGESSAFAKTAFDSKLMEYKQWIETFLPVFELYAQFANINATAQIQEAMNFYSILNNATLAYPKPVTIQI